MERVFVKAVFDLDCEWEGLPPVYRIYVNDELFVERTWAWTDHYLTEMLQIEAPPGQYEIKVETVKPCLAKFTVGNHRVTHGPAHWLDGVYLKINHAST